MIRRSDHVAIIVRSTDEALEYFAGRLRPPDRLVGGATRSRRAAHVSVDRERIHPTDRAPLGRECARDRPSRASREAHHVCFGVHDPVVEATALGGEAAKAGGGRGRVAPRSYRARDLMACWSSAPRGARTVGAEVVLRW